MKRTIVLAISSLCAFLFVALLPGRPAQTPRRPHFADMAARSQIAYRSNNSPGDHKYFPQPMCGGVATFDFDNDGRLDIFFTNGAQLPEMKKTNPSFYNCLLKQRPDGTFEDVTGKAGLTGKDLDFNFGVAVGDYDNDGYEDLFLCSVPATTRCTSQQWQRDLHGCHDSFPASGGKPAASTLSVAAAWFDYDNDGLLDLLVDNYTLWTPQTDIRCTMGSVEHYCDPGRYKSVPSRLYRNLGHGKFADVTEKSGLGASAGKW